MSPQQNQPAEPKTLIGVLASHDDVSKNNDLARLFEYLWETDRDLLGKFHFVFTGGTFQRTVLGQDTEKRASGETLKPIEDKEVIKFLISNSTSLPDRKYGGVTILANLIVQRQCSILWPFLSSVTVHWLHPENLALMRLCDIWNEKRLMNSGSVRTWFRKEAEDDAKRNPQKNPQMPLRLSFGAEGFNTQQAGRYEDKGIGTDIWLVDNSWLQQWEAGRENFVQAKARDKESLKRSLKEREDLIAEIQKMDNSDVGYYVPEPLHKKRVENPKDPKHDFWYNFKHQTIALIAHDAMKERMVNFAIEYERELAAFGRILATGTTGKEVEDATRRLKVKRCRSGPKGGDIEIATEILYGRCDVVIFFIDPLHPHPHMEDIRTVFSACMIENGVRMLTNEVQAREWMDVVVRRL
jgi:methylglyoxal synthase